MLAATVGGALLFLSGPSDDEAWNVVLISVDTCHFALQLEAAAAHRAMGHVLRAAEDLIWALAAFDVAVAAIRVMSSPIETSLRWSSSEGI